MIVSVQAMSTELTQKVLEKIPVEKRLKLKNGTIAPYVLAQEGLSQPKVLGHGAKVLKWSKEVIMQIPKVLPIGTKMFKGHGKNTNSHDGRTAIGEVVASFTDIIKGRLSSVAVAFFPDGSAAKDLDICSMEAEVDFDSEKADHVKNVRSISAVALGSSLYESPAFIGAERLGTIQCFESSGDEDKNLGDRKGKGMTYEEFKAAPFDFFKMAIKDRQIYPRQLYTREDLEKDDEFGKVYKTEAEIKAQLEQEKENTKKLSAEMDALKKAGERAMVKDKLSKGDYLPKDLADPIKKYILLKFNPDTLSDVSDGSISKEIEKLQKEFTEVAKILDYKDVSTSSSSQTKSEQTEPGAVDSALSEILGGN